MTCIKCGRQIPDGELFCAQCSLAPPAQEPAASRKAAKAAPKKAAPKKAAAPRRPVGLIVALVFALLIAAASTGYVVYDCMQSDTQAAALTRAQTELAQSNSRADTLNEALTRANDRISGYQEEIGQLQAEIDSLETQLNSTAGTATQSRFDLTEQQGEYAELTAEFEALTIRAGQLEADLAAAESALADTQGELAEANAAVSSLRTENAALSEKAGFFDAYAVFVTVDDPATYHRYGCSEIGSKDYWIYNRKLAESKGAAPCPLCSG